MEASTNQFNNVVSLDAKRAEKAKAKSPFGPISSGVVKQKAEVEVDEE